MKTAALLSLLPLASAFVPSTTPMVRGRTVTMAAQHKWADEAGGVKFFPDSDPYWDPCSIVKDADAKYFWRLQNGEVKNGRVAMLAVVDYLVKGFGIKLPFVFGDVSTADIPAGLGALKALPAAGWLQIIMFCGALELLTEKNEGNFVEGRTAGNVQPATPMFKAPGDREIRTKEINNGRLAMMAIFGMWAGELIPNGGLPLDVLGRVLGN